MLKIRKAEIGDADAVSSVHVRAVRGIISSHYSKEQLDAWAIPKSPDNYEASIKNKEFYVAEEDGGIIGFGVLDQNNSLIEALFVVPEIKRGIGRMLLNQLEDRARMLGIEVLSLNASLNAVNFYTRSGYEAQRKAVYRLYANVEIPCIQMAKKI